MARLDILLTGYDITDEIINRASSSSLKLDHDTIRVAEDVEIWTGAGGTGTQLALTTDYTLGDIDARLTTAAGVNIYKTLAIVNGAYHATDLYVTYKTVGDYASASTARLIGIGLKEITGAYTVAASDRTIIANTASAITITIPDGLPQGFDICILRSLASTAAITASMDGSETIEGGASFITHGAFASSTYNPSEVVLRKVSATSWKFVLGTVCGSVSGRGFYTKTPDHRLRQQYSATKSIEVATLLNGSYYGVDTWTHPVSFADETFSAHAQYYKSGYLMFGTPRDDTKDVASSGFLAASVGANFAAADVYCTYIADGLW